MAQNPSFPWVPNTETRRQSEGRGDHRTDARSDSPHRQRLHAVFSAFQDSGAGSSLALDVLLHELAEEACSVIPLSSSAIALRDLENYFVCRAVSGEAAPPIGTRIEGQDGLSAECLRSGQLQVCQDAESDGRVDAETCRALGMRAFVIVPLFLDQRLMGLLEVFAPNPHAFDRTSLAHLIDVGYRIVETVAFAEARVQARVSIAKTEQTRERVPVPGRPWVEVALPERHNVNPEPAKSMKADSVPQAESMPRPVRPQAEAPAVTKPRPVSPAVPEPAVSNSEVLSLTTPVLGKPRRNFGLAVAALSVGVIAIAALWWLPRDGGQARSAVGDVLAARRIPTKPDPVAASNGPVQPNATRGRKPSAWVKTAFPAPRDKNSVTQTVTPASGGLVVYEKGKVVYRAAPGSGALVGPVTSAAETERLQDTTRSAVPIDPRFPSAVISGGKLIHQVAPVVPPEVVGLHVPEEVLLEGIVGQDGTVREIRFIRGDSRLFGAAIEAVRQWRYEPFRSNGDPVDMLSTLSVRFR